MSRKTVIEALVKDMVSDTNINAEIHPIDAKTTDNNFIIYTPRNGNRESFYNGSFGKATLIIQLDLYCDTYINCLQLLDYIVEKYNGFSGILQSQQIDSIKTSILTDELSILDSGNKHRVGIDLTLLF